MIDETFEKVIDLLLRMTIERDEFRAANAKLHQDLWHAVAFGRKELDAATAVVDEWERKNGDAPHISVRLADRIRVNAGLANNGLSDGEG